MFKFYLDWRMHCLPKVDNDNCWAEARLNCSCMVCYEQQQIQIESQFKDFHKKFIIDEADYEKGNRKKAYSWLLQMLAPPPPIK